MDFASYTLSLAGGMLIGLSATLLLLVNGRVAGISGILGGLILPQEGEVSWRAWFVSGLLLGGLILLALRPGLIASSTVPTSILVVAGLLVGFGTRLGGGCTSGHGVCGMSRLSKRSMVATATFMVTGALATYVVQHVILAGGAP